MKKIYTIILTILILTFLSISSTFCEDLYSYNYLKLGIENKIEFQMNFESNYQINKFNIISTFFPNTINNSQYLNEFESNQQDYKLYSDNLENPYLKFQFDKNSLKKRNYIDNQYYIESIKTKPKIRTKYTYPIYNLNKKYKKYLGFTKLIDTNNILKSQSSKIIEGETDIYIIANKIANYIENDIKYNLSSVLENPNQKSTQVFKSKMGVCKEITNLYVSMLRSLGIPARVVSGYAYTDSVELSEFLNSNWGGHAWAEVLIGNTWVPFDLTYKEHGYIDATHIILEKNIDSKTNTIQINASGYGFNIVKNSLQTKTNITLIDKKKIKENNEISIKISGEKELGFSSFGYLKLEVKNLEDYYQTISLSLSKAEEIILISENKKLIILKPNEKREVYFKFQIPKNLKSDYIYTFPFSIQNDYLKLNYNITSTKNSKILQLEDLPKEEKEEIKIFSENEISINCNSSIQFNYNLIQCNLFNPNNYKIKNINLCISNNNCIKENLNINEEKTIEFKTINYNETINYNYEYKCNNQICIKKKQKTINIKQPKINLDSKLTFENLILNYSIENFQKNFKNQIIINNKIISINSNKSNSQIKLKLKKGNNSIQFQTKIENLVLDKKELNIFIKETKYENWYKKLNIFEKILEWIKNLFI